MSLLVIMNNEATPASKTTEPVKRGRGRPPGSKNKPKKQAPDPVEVVETTVDDGDWSNIPA